MPLYSCQIHLKWNAFFFSATSTCEMMQLKIKPWIFSTVCFAEFWLQLHSKKFRSYKIAHNKNATHYFKSFFKVSVNFMLCRLNHREWCRLDFHLASWMFEVKSMLKNIFFFILFSLILLLQPEMVWFLPPDKKVRWVFLDISKQYPCEWC